MTMNDLLIKKAHYSLLFSYYGELLTDKQQEIFKAYYEDDYSLSEISESLEISRNAVHDSLQLALKNLEQFEQVLKLAEKAQIKAKLFSQYHNQEISDGDLISKLEEME